MSSESSSRRSDRDRHQFRQRLSGRASRSPVQIELTNGDAGISHNLAIYSDPSASKVLFRGDQFRGPKTTIYQVRQLPMRTLFFRSDTHPAQTTGTFIVG